MLTDALKERVFLIINLTLLLRPCYYIHQHLVYKGDGKQSYKGMGIKMDQNVQVDSCKLQEIENADLIILTEEELKKEELISVLAGLIKNYSMKQQNK